MVDEQVIEGLIQQMAEGYRILIHLYAIEGMCHIEVPEYLGIKVGTSTSQYHRATRELWSCLMQWAEEWQQLSDQESYV